MELHKLLKVKLKQKKRIGRGEGSGKGKTAGRGEKGQKKRGKVALGFEGGQLPIYKRLPQKRGVGNLNHFKKIAIKTDKLNKFSTGSIVDTKNLIEAGLLTFGAYSAKLKIVVGGKIEKKLSVKIPATKKAKILIEKAGGNITDANTN